NINVYAATNPATNFFWVGSVSSDWFTPSNWVPRGVPGALDTANITNGGTVTLSSSATVSNLNLVSGTLNGAGNFTVSSNVNWSGGNVACPLTIISNGVMNVSGNSTKYLQSALTNAGTVNWTDTGAFYVQNNNSSLSGAIYNLAGGLWDFQNDPSYVYCYYCNGYELFNNAGTVEKSGGTGT